MKIYFLNKKRKKEKKETYLLFLFFSSYTDSFDFRLHFINSSLKDLKSSIGKEDGKPIFDLCNNLINSFTICSNPATFFCNSLILVSKNYSYNINDIK